MKIRRLDQNELSLSIRMNKDEWETTKANGDANFKNRNVGYMNVVPGRVQFETTSPFFKDMTELDNQNKEKSVEQEAIDKAVAEEISKKVK